MPRPIWNGSLSFGLVTIDDAEMAALDPKSSRSIDLVEFVDQASIDPTFYDSAYFLAPDPGTPKPYALLREAMASTDKVAIGSFVMRSKERLCAIRPGEGGTLLLSTMRYADEIRSSEEIEQFEALDDLELSKGELAMAEQLIANLDAEFDPTRFHDKYREKMLELVARKSEGDESVIPAPADSDDGGGNKVIDLMAALEASVAEAKEARMRHPTDSDDADKTA